MHKSDNYKKKQTKKTRLNSQKNIKFITKKFQDKLKIVLYN